MPQERLSFARTKRLPPLFCLAHRYIRRTLGGFQIWEYVLLDLGGGRSIVYVVSGYVQMGLFWMRASALAPVRACVNSYICFCVAYLNGANAKETLL